MPSPDCSPDQTVIDPRPDREIPAEVLRSGDVTIYDAGMGRLNTAVLAIGDGHLRIAVGRRRSLNPQEIASLLPPEIRKTGLLQIATVAIREAEKPGAYRAVVVSGAHGPFKPYSINDLMAFEEHIRQALGANEITIHQSGFRNQPA